MKKPVVEKSRLLGTFLLPSGQEVFGELRVRGRNTVLRLRDKHLIPSLGSVKVIYGETHDRHKISCLGCVVSSSGLGWTEDKSEYHYADIFPHFVAIGHEHLSPQQPSITAMRFTLDDLKVLFYDFDAFGRVFDAGSLIESVVSANSLGRQVPIGDLPIITYFTGKRDVVAVETAIGKISVRHSPSSGQSGWSGPSGVAIQNQMMVIVEPQSPVPLKDCMERTGTVLRFLSLLAGRRQGIKFMDLDLATESDRPRHSLHLKLSFAPGSGKQKGDSSYKPHPGDIPLNAIRQPDEFAAVLKEWISREPKWWVARVRYANCLSKGSSYTVDRLIAAANMFDILPVEAFPAVTEIPPELALARDECLAIFRKQPPGIGRDSVILALKRMNRPSLPTRVMHRASIVEREMGSLLPDLSVVLKTAVKCRNYFVHGGLDDFDYTAIESLTSFLTDALEFVFAASDLIEAGWNARAWNDEAHIDGHSFARFLLEYETSLGLLKTALKMRA